MESQSNLSDPLISAAGIQLGKMDLSGCPGTSTPISDQSSLNADLSLQVIGTQFKEYLNFKLNVTWAFTWLMILPIKITKLLKYCVWIWHYSIEMTWWKFAAAVIPSFK
jgi:hypothetical protein